MIAVEVTAKLLLFDIRQKHGHSLVGTEGGGVIPTLIFLPSNMVISTLTLHESEIFYSPHLRDNCNTEQFGHHSVTY